MKKIKTFRFLSEFCARIHRHQRAVNPDPGGKNIKIRTNNKKLEINVLSVYENKKNLKNLKIEAETQMS